MTKKAKDLIASAKQTPVSKVSAKALHRQEKLVETLKAEIVNLRRAVKSAKGAPKIKVLRGKATKHELTVVVPDSHGNLIDVPARDAFLADLRRIRPTRIVLLGDHLDAGGTFNAHQRTYTKEMTESYADDTRATNEFFDLMQEAAPDAEYDYLEGNHEQHVERFLARNFSSFADAEMLLGLMGPEAVLRLKARGIRYYRSAERYMGISIPGTIKIGKMFYTHGICAGQNATANHLSKFGASVSHGHTHRAAYASSRTVTTDGIAAFCPGTLAKLQPVYMHTNPSGWTHGYEIVTTSMASGNFSAQLVPILDGVSMLFTDAFKRAV